MNAGGPPLFPRRRIPLLLGAALLVIAAVVGGLGTVVALQQPALPGGAPAPRPGPFRPGGFVRVIDGDTFETTIDGRRAGVGVLGIDAPNLGTPCGDAARDALQALVGGGVLLEDEPGILLDGRRRRMYRVTAPDGQSVALALVTAGLARADGRGSETPALAAAEATALQNGVGCVGGGPVPARQPRPRVPDGGGMPAASVPSSFADETVASGLSFPTGFAFLPDGRLLVTEKAGTVKLVANGVVQPTPVVDLRSQVNSFWDRGLLGIAVDPSFNANRFFYVYFTHEHNAGDIFGPKTNRLVRFAMDQNNQASPGGGTVLLGSQTGDGCPDPPTQADCLPAEDWSHGGGSLRFASDGALFVTVGDAASFQVVDTRALRAQSLDSYAGKILRVTSTGQGIPGNPHWNGNPNATPSKIWARGLRNPFRLTLRPGSNVPYVGDVGWISYEEIDIATSGTNLGWPCYEGAHVQDGYAGLGVCPGLYGQGPAAVRMPLIEWDHGPDQNVSGAALAGTFYSGTAFPTTYQGAFFYADYGQGWIKYVRVDGNDQLAGAPTMFAQGIPGPVALETGADGALYYAAIASGEIHRIRFVAAFTPISCPAGQFRAEYYGSPTNEPPNHDLSGAPAFQQCEAAIDYTWGGGRPDPRLGDDHFSIRWTGRFTFGTDTYEFKTISDDGSRLYVDGVLVIDDWAGGAANERLVQRAMTAGEHEIIVEYFDDISAAEIRASWRPLNPNQAPTTTIAAPTAGATFRVGDVIQLQGSATDPQDGSIPDERLRWDIVLQHCPGFGASCHNHPILTFTGRNAQFAAPDHGDGSYFEISLTATDSAGLTHKVTTRLDPRQVQLTLTTDPPGGTVQYDGSNHPAPFTATTIVGSTHTISVQPGSGQQFRSWAHGGPQQQNVTAGEQNTTYTAQLSLACAPRPVIDLDTVALGGGRLQVTVTVPTNAGHQTNPLTAIRFDESRLAEIEISGRPRSAAPFTVPFGGGTTQATFVVHRTGAGAVLVRFAVIDGCGEWPTFVGGGPAAF